MITSFTTFINESEGLGLDAYSPEELGRMLIGLCKKKKGINLSKVKDLIDGGADINIRDSDVTALYFAAMNGHLEAVKELLAAGATPYIEDEDRWTPLHYAAREGYDGVLRALLDAGSSPEPINDVGWTPLHLATQYGHVEIVKELLDAGASKDVRDLIGWTPLHYAAKRGYLKIAKALLAAGASLNVKNNEGKTPWDLASMEMRKSLPKLKP